MHETCKATTIAVGRAFGIIFRHAAGESRARLVSSRAGSVASRIFFVVVRLLRRTTRGLPPPSSIVPVSFVFRVSPPPPVSRRVRARPRSFLRARRFRLGLDHALPALRRRSPLHRPKRHLTREPCGGDGDANETSGGWNGRQASRLVFGPAAGRTSGRCARMGSARFPVLGSGRRRGVPYTLGSRFGSANAPHVAHGPSCTGRRPTVVSCRRPVRRHPSSVARLRSRPPPNRNVSVESSAGNSASAESSASECWRDRRVAESNGRERRHAPPAPKGIPSKPGKPRPRRRATAARSRSRSLSRSRSTLTRISKGWSS